MKSSRRWAPAPDGESIVFTSGGELVVCDLPACSSRRSLASLGTEPRWMPDGRAVACIDRAAPSNLWMQPHDGKRLAIARSTTTNDIVLFKGLRR